MEQYLQRTYLAGLFNRIGLKVLVFALCGSWFIYLWGWRPSALIAGTALSVLVMMAIRLFNKRTVNLREEELRRRIGGELAVEKLLLSPKRQAHFQAALWLGISYPIRMENAMNDGLICTLDEKRLLVRCILRHESEKIACEEIISLQRAAIKYHADKAVACVTSELTDAAKGYAETAAPPISVVDKKELIRLAGIMLPATNEQLIALGQSKKRKGSRSMWVAHVLSRHRSKRYFLYGAGLLALYFVTRLPYYPVPGVTLICLSILSRVYPKKASSL